jgi:hypothetical protein
MTALRLTSAVLDVASMEDLEQAQVAIADALRQRRHNFDSWVKTVLDHANSGGTFQALPFLHEANGKDDPPIEAIGLAKVMYAALLRALEKLKEKP